MTDDGESKHRVWISVISDVGPQVHVEPPGRVNKDPQGCHQQPAPSGGPGAYQPGHSCNRLCTLFTSLFHLLPSSFIHKSCFSIHECSSNGVCVKTFLFTLFFLIAAPWCSINFYLCVLGVFVNTTVQRFGPCECQFSAMSFGGTLTKALSADDAMFELIPIFAFCKSKPSIFQN